MISKSWLVLILTGSTLIMGLTNAIGAFPLLLGFFGGITADRFNRHKLLTFFLAVKTGMALVVAILIYTKFLTFSHLITVIIILGIINALAGPTESVFLSDIIGKKDLMNATGLNRTTTAVVSIIAAFITGIFIDIYGVGFCYLLEAIIRAASLVSFYFIRAEGIKVNLRPGNPFTEIKKGLRYIRNNKALLGLLALALSWNLFISVNGFRLTLLPVFARDILIVGASGYGMLTTANKVGAFIGAIIIANLGEFRRKGWLLITSAILMGLSLIMFPTWKGVPLSLISWSFVGLMTTIYNSTSEVLLLTNSSEEMRGRVMGARFQVWMFMPINATWAGALADLAGVSIAIKLGGLLWVVAVLLIVILIPQLRKL